MAVLGSIAVLLAAMGLYSVMACWVAQRTHEIGVRMALGAERGQVLRLVVRQGLSLTLGGLLVGTILALAASRSLSALSFTNSAMGANAKLLGESAADPLIYIAAAAFLCALGALAAYLPARRAAAIDPMQSLRAD
jgi:ABC-type antimicrobial peptide transport system permease subunit